jgi:hypothetical protein
MSSNTTTEEPAAGFTESEMNTILTSAVVLNAISIVCTIAVLVVYLFLRATRPSLVNRTSLRIAVATAIADLFYSIAQIYSDLLTGDGIMCAVSVWWYILFTLLTIFLTAAVAINLQVVFLHGRHDARSLEKWYYIGAVVLAVVISGSGFFGKQYGWDDLQSNCWFIKDGTKEGTIWQWGTIYAWLLIVVVYCLAVIAAVLVRINKEADSLDIATVMTGTKSQTSSITSPPPSPTFPPSPTLGAFGPESSVVNPNVAKHMLKKRKRKNLARILKRIILYPLIPVITQTPNLIVTMQASATGSNTFFIVWLSFAANSIQGMLNCIIFFIDPAVKSGIADYMEERRERKQKSSNVPKMVLTTEDKVPLAPEQAAHGKKWRRNTGTGDASPTATVFGDAGPSTLKGQDYLGVELETGNWKFQQEDEEAWFKLL